MVLGNIELVRAGDTVWVRHLVTGEVAEVSVDKVGRIAERLFGRLF